VFSERRDNELRIDISPLIDVVFLLLIFFMVTTTFSEQQSVDIQLPSAQGEAHRTDRKLPELVMDKDGGVRLDGQPVAVDELADRLRKAVEGLPEGQRVVVVRGDRDARWELGLKVMDQMRQAGVTAASALTEPKAALEEAAP